MDRIKLYKYHCANLRDIEFAFEEMLRLGRQGIRSKNEKSESTAVKVACILCGTWAEVRLLKLITEDSAVLSHIYNDLMAKSPQIDKWLKLWNYCFNIKFDRVSSLCLGKSGPFENEYLEIRNLIDVDLRKIIEIRNKIAHGQFSVALNGKNTELSSDHQGDISSENILSVTLKRNIIECLSNCMHDLAVSKDTFERDIKVHFDRLFALKHQLKNKSYEKYKENMIRSAIRPNGIA